MAKTRSGVVLGRNEYEINGRGEVSINRKAKEIGKLVDGTPPVTYKGSKGYNSLRGLLVQEDDIDKAVIFQFNPETITESKSTNYASRSYTGLSFESLIWSGGGERLISFQLFLDATASSNTKAFRKDVVYGNAGHEDLQFSRPRGVMDEVELLNSFLYPRMKKNASSPSLPVPLFSAGGVVPENQFVPPPVAIFCYGEYYLRGIVKEVTTTHLLFNEKLISTRCTCDITFAVSEQTTVTVNPNIRNKSSLPPAI